MLQSFIFLDSTFLVFCGASHPSLLGGGKENSLVGFKNQLFTHADSIANNLIPSVAFFPESPAWFKSSASSHGRDKTHPQFLCLYFQPPKANS